MDKLEKAEKVRAMTGASFEDAKAALEACEYDVLDAIVWLEQQGKSRSATAEYTTSAADAYNATAEMSAAQSDYERATKSSSFTQGFTRLMNAVRTVLRKSIDVSFVVSRDGKQVLSVPVLVLVLLLFFAFWICIPLLIVGLFFDFRYSFDGIGTVTIDINEITGKASEGVDHLKRDLSGDDKQVK